jgi:hypothetical protein
MRRQLTTALGLTLALVGCAPAMPLVSTTAPVSPAGSGIVTSPIGAAQPTHPVSNIDVYPRAIDSVVAGQALLPSGPLANAQVVLKAIGSDDTVGTGTTDDQGNFSIVVNGVTTATVLRVFATGTTGATHVPVTLATLVTAQPVAGGTAPVATGAANQTAPIVAKFTASPVASSERNLLGVGLSHLLATSAMTIDTIKPADGLQAGGYAVKITGTGFAAVDTVKFGDIKSTSISVDSDTQITAKLPDGLKSGTLSVHVSSGEDTANAASAALNYAYTVLPPFISSFQGDSHDLIIVGAGFSGTKSVTVTDGGAPVTAASFVVVNDSKIHLQSDPGVPSGGLVTVVAPGGSVTKARTLQPQPSVSSVNLVKGSLLGGDRVTITGSNFSTYPGDANVWIGTFNNDCQAKLLYVNVLSDTQLTATTPSWSDIPHNYGRDYTLDIGVSNDSAQTVTQTLKKAFTYVDVPLSVTSISPDQGSRKGGDQVIITGTGFDLLRNRNEVSFGGSGYFSQVKVLSPTQLTAITPAEETYLLSPGSDGFRSITVDSRTATGEKFATFDKGFKFVDIAPTIATIYPVNPAPFTTVHLEISGTGFDLNTRLYLVRNGIRAALLKPTLVSDNRIDGTIDNNQGPGTVDVVVEGAGGSATLKSALSFGETITAISPAQANVGGVTTVKITGTQFSDIFDLSVKMGGDYVQGIVVNADHTTITGIAPVRPAGTVDVVVQNRRTNEQFTLKQGFTYGPCPPGTVSDKGNCVYSQKTLLNLATTLAYASLQPALNALGDAKGTATVDAASAIGTSFQALVAAALNTLKKNQSLAAQLFAVVDANTGKGKVTSDLANLVTQDSAFVTAFKNTAGTIADAVNAAVSLSHLSLPAQDKLPVTFGTATATFLSTSSITVSTLAGTSPQAGGGTGNVPPESVSLSGTVSLGANQAQGVQVALYFNGNTVPVAQTQTDALGNYAFFFLSHGTYTIVFAANGAQSSTRVVTI